MESPTRSPHLDFPSWLSPAERLAIGGWLASAIAAGVVIDELWLFGSRARARSHEESDVDLLWIGPGRPDLNHADLDGLLTDLAFANGLGADLPALSPMRARPRTDPLSFFNRVSDEAIRMM